MSTSASSYNSASPSASAYMFASRAHSDSDDEVASLPSTSASDSSLEGELSTVYSDDESDAEREWKESLQQLELLLTMVIIPFVGKFLGRKCAYWGWGKFMEWKYPVEVVVTDKGVWRGAGVVEAGASL